MIRIDRLAERQGTWGARCVVLAATLVCLGACEGLPGSAKATQDANNAPAAAVKPSEVDPQLKLAAIQAEAQNNYLEAAQHYQSLLSRDPDNLELAIGLARNLRFAGSTPQDIDILNQLIAKRGRTPQLLTELGKSYVSSDQMNLAVPTLQEATSLEGATWDSFSTLGVAFDYQGQYDRAREEYAQALMLSPRNPDVLNNLALSQAQSGDLDGAIETLGQATDQASATPQIRQNLALLLALKGDTASAERLARKDLPKDMADLNADYYRYLAGAN
ncbi:MAG: tetratricopeptide repeat protein [Proteobacteria bacterium]|nr:tetratricopeptide repeat protein [Pseudomonadota bacterium]